MQARPIFFRLTLPTALLAALIARPVVAQPPFGGAGGYRGPDVDEIISRLDRDQDGRVEPGEYDGPFRPVIEGLAREHGLNLSEPLGNGRLRDLLRAKFGGRTPGGTGVSGATSTPGVPGFGTAADGSPLPSLGFGPPDTESWIVLKQKYDPRVIDRVDESMYRYDRDKDNLLDREETRRADFSGNPYEFDRNLDGKLSRSEIAERYKARYSQGNNGNNNNNGYGWRPGGGPPGGPSNSNNGQNSNSPGSSNNSGGSNNSSNSSSGGDADRVAKYAEGLLKQYDSNNDGRLQKNEWSNMRGEPKKADRNNDDIVTREELAQHLSDYGRSRSESSGGKSGTAVDRKTYRFTSPTERFPSGLPEWFAEKDADRDGQVQMNEYATTWNDARAQEFAGWDANGDGTVTPAECLKRQAETESTSDKEDDRRSYGSRRY